METCCLARSVSAAGAWSFARFAEDCGRASVRGHHCCHGFV